MSLIHLIEMFSDEPDWLQEYTINNASIDSLTKAMKEKIEKKRKQGRGKWWHDDYCSQETLSTMLREHVEKGDPIDVALFAMMLFARGEQII